MQADTGALTTIASVLAVFGAGMLFFRVQREALSLPAEQRVRLVPSDWLLIATTMTSLLFVLLPIAAGSKSHLPAAVTAWSAILIAGYVPSIFARYRVFLGRTAKGPRSNPEALEMMFTLITVVIAAAVGMLVLTRPAMS
jgi:hypothetical protein